jgi:acyl carrier protein
VAVVPLYITPSLVRIRRPKKVDLDAELIAQAAGTTAAREEGTEARVVTDVERAIRDIWAEVLGRRPGVNDNFFELGGDSMTAIQVTALMKARLGREITLVKLYEMPTISLLAQALGAESAADHVEALAGVDRRAETRLESMQRRRRARTEPVLENAS